MSALGYVELGEFRTLAEAAGVTVPEAVTRGLALIDAAHDYAAKPLASHLLDLKPSQVPRLVDGWSLRDHASNGAFSRRGLVPGVARLVDGVLLEVEAAVRPQLDALVADELRPRFDEAVAPYITGAQQYGWTYQTTSDEVVLLADEPASQVWRDIRLAAARVAPIIEFRRRISAIFQVAPTDQDLQGLRDAASRSFVSPRIEDDTVSFGDGAWSFDGTFCINGKPEQGIDFLALAVHGLRLNTPSEVQAMIAERRQQVLEQLVAEAQDLPKPPILATNS